MKFAGGGPEVGGAVGVGLTVGAVVGADVVTGVGLFVGTGVGVGAFVGAAVGTAVGVRVGGAVGADVGVGEDNPGVLVALAVGVEEGELLVIGSDIPPPGVHEHKIALRPRTPKLKLRIIMVNSVGKAGRSDDTLVHVRGERTHKQHPSGTDQDACRTALGTF
jgi:hypothetical protein